MDIDATNIYAEDPPIDKTFYDYVDDQYRDFYKDNTGKDMIGYVYSRR